LPGEIDISILFLGSLVITLKGRFEAAFSFSIFQMMLPNSKGAAIFEKPIPLSRKPHHEKDNCSHRLL
jgi:hypothetical protein